MKRLVALVGGSLFLFGLPLVLISTGMTPIGVASAFVEAMSVRNPVQLGTQVGLLGLWSTWVWGFGSVVIDVIRTWGVRHDHSVGVMSSRYSLLFVVALWSILFASRPSAAAAKSVEIEQVMVAPQTTAQDMSHSQVPLAIGGSAVLVAGLLIHCDRLRIAQLKRAPAGSFMNPMSQRAAFTWSELRHRHQPQYASGLLAVTDSLLTDAQGAQVVAVNQHLETRSLVSMHNETNRAFAYVPLGVSADETVLVALAPGMRFDIAAPDINLAKTAARHLMAVAQLASIAGDFRVVVESDVLLDVLPETSQTARSGVIRFVIDSTGDLGAPNPVIASNEALVKICVASDHPNRMQLCATGWEIMPSGQQLSVFGLTEFENSALRDLVQEAAKPVVVDTRNTDTAMADWNVCVRLLGPVDAETRCGTLISFEKSKSLELLAWLMTHRERPTRIAARTALWEISVQDATFNNVVSGLRRGLASGSDVKQEVEFLAKTFTDHLSIHGSVISDVDVLNKAMSDAKNFDDAGSWIQLHDALGRVRDLPFAGTDYLWPDTEGITSNFILSVITGSVLAAEHALLQGDTEGVFWATGQGLKVLHGHEELVALRMRAYGEVGDRAGVNAEWASYERSILHDSWSGGSPSPRIVELKEELIG